MAIDSVSSITSNSATAKSRATMAENFDTFLSLLTTQLRNQNPLDPLDTNQFTQQLVQFSGVEQQLQTNDYLEALLNISQSNPGKDAVNYVGKTVTVAGRTTELVNGSATWSFALQENAETATITIADENGNEVFSKESAFDAGEWEFAWDGIQNDGSRAADGSYTISINAKNADGGTIVATTSQVGLVTAVDFSGSEPMLTVGNTTVSLSDVLKVQMSS